MSGFRRNEMASALAQQMGPPQSSADLEFMLQNEIGDYRDRQAIVNSGLAQGGWGAVGAALGSMFTRGKGEKQKAKISTMMREYFNAQNSEQSRAAALEEQKAAAAQEKQLAALAKRYGRDDAEAIVYGGLKPSDLKATRLPGKLGEYEALQGLDPQSRAGFMEYLSAQRAPAPVVNVNTPPRESAFGRELGKRDAALFADQRNKAISAQQAMNSIDGLDKILSNTATGKQEELYGQLAQWVGAPEGADYQATNALVNERVFELINALKGPATDKDAERAQAQIPNMGTDPRARAVVFDYLRKKAGTDIQMYEEMEDWLGKGNQSFNGFRPSVGQFSVNTSALGGEGGSVGGEEPIAVNDKGEKLAFRNGRWVHIK